MNTGSGYAGWPAEYKTFGEYAGRGSLCSRATNRPAIGRRGWAWGFYMMKYAMLGALCALLPNGVALAAGEPSQCEGLKKQYTDDADMSARWMALGVALGGQVSSTRQSAIEAKQANSLARMKIDIDLLKASGCRIPAAPSSAAKYEAEANQCLFLVMGQEFGFASPHGGTCDIYRWRGMRQRDAVGGEAPK